jgi:tRNA/tmRNA/rRNA uracil-C5-methylase (TrmA/RlmC/RlmD family)
MDPTQTAAAYAAHAAAKEAALRALLADAGMDALYRGLVPSPVAEGWRTQLSFRVQRRAEGGPRLHGVDPLRGNVAVEEAMWVAPVAARPTLLAVAAALAPLAAEGVATGFDARLEHGSLRPFVSVHVPRDVDADGARRAAEAVAALSVARPEMVGIAVPSLSLRLGGEWLENVVLGRTVLAPPLSFFQTNAHVTPLLAAEAKSGGEDARTLVDLYCGVGLHSVLATAGREREMRVVGADSARQGIEGARRNAALHGMDADYRRETAESFAGSAGLERPDRVVVNPSRFGCGPGVARGIGRWRASQVCLVSCSPESHVRDVQALAAEGYRPLGVRGFDMFPFTDGFVECVTHFDPA